MRQIWAVALVLGVLFGAGPVGAQCAFHLDETPFPSDIKGRVAYLDATAKALYIYDFKTKIRVRAVFTGAPAFTDIGNPVWTPDGRGLVFPGYQGSSAQLYYWKATVSGSSTLVALNTRGSRNEDPHFLSNGKKLVWKRDYGIATGDVDFAADGTPILNAATSVVAGVKDTNEYSGPVYSPTGKYIYFWKGAKAAATVGSYNTVTGQIVAFTKPVGIQVYYPRTTGYYSFLYTRWADAMSQRDTIWQFSTLNNTLEEWNPADCNNDKADPAPADEDLLLYVRLIPNTINVPGKHYVMYLGRLSDGQSWSLPLNVGTGDGNLLGPDYTAVPVVSGPPGLFAPSNR